MGPRMSVWGLMRPMGMIQSDLYRLHARADGRAGILLGNAEIGENFLLSLGLRACVAAHGRDDERLCAVLAHDLTDRADNERDVGDLA